MFLLTFTYVATPPPARRIFGFKDTDRRLPGRTPLELVALQGKSVALAVMLVSAGAVASVEDGIGECRGNLSLFGGRYRLIALFFPLLIDPRPHCVAPCRHRRVPGHL